MNNKTALRKNIISNITLFVLNAAIGFWLPKFLVGKLGFSAYGLIPLSNTIINYAAVITVAINGTLSRFLILDITKKDYEGASKTFNTALAAILGIFIFLVPVFIMFAINIGSYISIPAELINQATFLFCCIGVTFFITTFTAMYNSSAYVANRLDLVNRVSLINTYVRVSFILIIFFGFSVSLFGYGIAVLIAASSASLYSYYLFRKYTPYITINPRSYDLTILKKILNMGGWLAVIQIGSILFNQIDLVVINKVFGSEQAGKYSVVLQLSMIIRMFATTVSGALGPLILNLYAKNKVDQMIKLTILSNKALSLFIACIVGVIIVMAPSFLSLWINKGFSNMSDLLILLVVALPINLGVMPLFSLNRAYNKVKWPGIFTAIMGVLNILLAIYLAKYTSLGIFGVAISGGIVLTLKNFVFMPLYTASTMGINKFTFYPASISSIIIVAIALVVHFFYSDYFSYVNNWGGLVIYSSVIFVFFAALSYLMLKKSEKVTIVDVILKRTK